MTEPQNMFPEGTPARRVIDYATKLFTTKGVKCVTMDDIAKGLQMSKRTLYQLFADKEQLIIACLQVQADKERILANELIKSDHNVLEIILRIFEYRLKALDNISPQYIIDIARYDAVQKHLQVSHEEAISRSERMFKVGVAQGLFREDVNVKLLMRYILLQENKTIASTILTDYSIPECFINFGVFHLRGCCTPKGIELIDKFLDHYRNEQSANG